MSSVGSDNSASGVDIDAGFAKINALLGDVSGIFSADSIITGKDDESAVPPHAKKKQAAAPAAKSTKKEDKMTSLLANLSADEEASQNPIKQMNSAEGHVIAPPKSLVNTEIDDKKEPEPLFSTRTQVGAKMVRIVTAIDSGASVLGEKFDKIQGAMCAPVTDRPYQGRPGCTMEGAKEDAGGVYKEPRTYYVAATEGCSDKPKWGQVIANIESMPRWMLVGTLICLGLVTFVVVFASVDGTSLNQALRDQFDARAFASDEAHTVAFLGNSYLYVNDVPRMMESISSDKITQQSVINTNAGLGRLLKCGNGMYELWNSENAVDVWGEWDYSAVTNGEDYELYDYGFCTVPQLLEGYDGYLSYRNMNGVYYDAGTNPCFEDEYYMAIVQRQSARNPMYFDYVVLNDQTKRMAEESAREDSISALAQAYAPLLKSTRAVPVLIDTHAYLLEEGNSTLWENYYEYMAEQRAQYKAQQYQENGEEEAEEEEANNNKQKYKEYQPAENIDWENASDEIAEFTSDIYQGLYEYAEVLKALLPTSQQPRIAKVGMAYLAIYDDDVYKWFKLFGNDMVHASPHGSYLLGCVLYAAIYGHMPKPVETDNDVRKLFVHSRAMFGENLQYPTVQEANYLRKWARKVQLEGFTPHKFRQPVYNEENTVYKQLHANDTYIWPELNDDWVEEDEPEERQ